VEDVSGKEIVGSKKQAKAEIPRQKIQQMQNLRQAQGIPAKIRTLPHLLQKSCARRQAAGSYQGQLVTLHTTPKSEGRRTETDVIIGSHC
jgi:hypothetical protein